MTMNTDNEKAADELELAAASSPTLKEQEMSETTLPATTGNYYSMERAKLDHGITEERAAQILAAMPIWATEEDSDFGASMTPPGTLLLGWTKHNAVDLDSVMADIRRDDIVDLATGIIARGPVEIYVWLGPHDAVVFDNVKDLEEAAKGLAWAAGALMFVQNEAVES